MWACHGSCMAATSMTGQADPYAHTETAAGTTHAADDPAHMGGRGDGPKLFYGVIIGSRSQLG